MSPPALRFRSSQCWMIGKSYDRANSIARRITQPITELSNFAAQVAAQPDADWGRPRIPGRDEVARMGRAFERMLGALRDGMIVATRA